MTKVRGLVFGLALGVSVSSLIAGPCRCLRRSLRAYLDRAPAVFMGEISPVGARAFQRIARVDVRRIWKGKVPAQLMVETPADESLCGLDLTQPGRFLFFSAPYLGDGPFHGHYSVSVCEGSRPWDDVFEAELGKGRAVDRPRLSPALPRSELEGTDAPPIPVPGG